jgi:hypothetical protein
MLSANLKWEIPCPLFRDFPALECQREVFVVLFFFVETLFFAPAFFVTFRSDLAAVALEEDIASLGVGLLALFAGGF